MNKYKYEYYHIDDVVIKMKGIMYMPHRIIAVMAFIWLVIAFPVVASAKLLEPWQYLEGTCELAAKEYRAIYGGDLVFIQPLKDNGAFDLGEYNGAWLNKAWDKERGTYYTYYPTGDYFNNTDDIQSWYKYMTGKKSEIYDVNEVHTPFPIIWHY